MKPLTSYLWNIIFFLSKRIVSLHRNILTKLKSHWLAQGHKGENCVENNWFLDLAFDQRTAFLQTFDNQAGQRTQLSNLLPCMNPGMMRKVHQGKVGRGSIKKKNNHSPNIKRHLVLMRVWKLQNSPLWKPKHQGFLKTFELLEWYSWEHSCLGRERGWMS